MKLSLQLTNRVLFTAASAVTGVVLLLFAADILLDAPLRSSIERRMNEALIGYTVSIRRADFHVFGGSIDLDELVVRQMAHPDPPVANIPRLSASVQWLALLQGGVVADFSFESPEIHADLAQLSEETRDPIPVTKRGWQDALEAVYPLKINELWVRNGSLVYRDVGVYRPLRLGNIQFVARNIRNIHSRDHVYPSEVHLQAAVFDNGLLRMDGKADFLAKPFPGIRGDGRLQHMDLSYFEPVARKFGLSIQRGLLDAVGSFEYAPEVQSLELQEVEIRSVAAEYRNTTANAEHMQAVERQVSRTAREVTDHPTVLIYVGTLRAIDSTVAYVNAASSPPYRVFASRASLVLENLSNQSSQGIARANLHGLFMGSGEMSASALFHPESTGPDFDLRVSIGDTDMPAMNELLRAYLNFDVVAGTFSFYSDINVHNGQMNGYIKPMFRAMNIYSGAQDRHKGLFHRLYEGLAGAVAEILENGKRKEVATVSHISGPVKNPRADTLQLIGGLIQNAFFKSILPGFEERRARRGKAAPVPRVTELERRSRPRE